MSSRSLLAFLLLILSIFSSISLAEIKIIRVNSTSNIHQEFLQAQSIEDDVRFLMSGGIYITGSIDFNGVRSISFENATAEDRVEISQSTFYFGDIQNVWISGIHFNSSLAPFVPFVFLLDSISSASFYQCSFDFFVGDSETVSNSYINSRALEIIIRGCTSRGAFPLVRSVNSIYFEMSDCNLWGEFSEYYSSVNNCEYVNITRSSFNNHKLGMQFDEVLGILVSNSTFEENLDVFSFTDCKDMLVLQSRFRGNNQTIFSGSVSYVGVSGSYFEEKSGFIINSNDSTSHWNFTNCNFGSDSHFLTYGSMRKLIIANSNLSLPIHKLNVTESIIIHNNRMEQKDPQETIELYWENLIELKIIGNQFRNNKTRIFKPTLGLDNCEGLTHADLSGNHLEDDFPSDLFRCAVNLQYINISGNFLKPPFNQINFKIPQECDFREAFSCPLTPFINESLCNSSCSFPDGFEPITTLPPHSTSPQDRQPINDEINAIKDDIKNGDSKDGILKLDRLVDSVSNGTFGGNPIGFCNDLCSLANSFYDPNDGINVVKRICNETLLTTNLTINVDTAYVIIVQISNTSRKENLNLFEGMNLVTERIFSNLSLEFFSFETPNVSLSAFRPKDLSGEVLHQFDVSRSSFLIPNGIMEEFNASKVLFSVIGYNQFINKYRENDRYIVSNVTGLSLFNQNGVELAIQNSSQAIIIRMKFEYDYSDLVCQFWDAATEMWKTDGCITSSIDYSTKIVVCECNHLTNFSVGTGNSRNGSNILQGGTNLSSMNWVAIGAGIGGSILGILIIIVIIIVFYIIRRRWRKSKEKIEEMEMEILLPNEYISPEKIRVQEKIGNGAYGAVYKGVFYETTPIALKQLQKIKELVSFVKEGNLMNTLHHPNCIQFLGFYESNSNLYIVLEYMELRSLLNFLTVEGENIEFTQLFSIARDIAAGLCYLEDMGIFHCDIAARNILMRSDEEGYHPKISDFGLARQPKNDIFVVDQNDCKFSIRWSAPEVLEDKLVSAKSDIWSFGIVLYEMFSKGIVPYHFMTNEEVIRVVKTGGHPELSDNWPIEMRSVAKKCWSFLPSSRPSASEIYRSIPLSVKVKPIPPDANRSRNYEDPYE